MAVQEQTPYIEHIANGVTTSFALGFVCDSADNLVVTINDLPTNVGDWSFSDGNVVFQYPPLLDSLIKIWRNSPLARSTTFKTYDNSLNPNSLNFDFDKIWLAMQELNVKNSFSDIKLQELLDALVEGNINGLPAEVLARIAGDESTKSLVNLEALRAYQAENNLNVRIDNESLIASQNIVAEKQRAEAIEQSLQIQVNSVGVGNKAYKTYALMDADKANIPAKSKVTVTNDIDSTNNGDWQWDGAVFTKSAYDPIQQANGYTDQHVQEKTGYLTEQIIEGVDYPLTVEDAQKKIAVAVMPDGTFKARKIESQTITADEFKGELNTGAAVLSDVAHNALEVIDSSKKIALAVKPDGTTVAARIDAKELLIKGKTLDTTYSTVKTGTFKYNIAHCECLGQSLSLGTNGSPILTPVQKYDNLMFIGGIRKQHPNNTSVDFFSSFVPLIEALSADNANPYIYGETPVGGLTEQIKDLIKSENKVDHTQQNYQLLGTASGEGGKRIHELRDTYVPNNLFPAITEAYNLAQASGKTYGMSAITFVHGEADNVNPTTQDQYKSITLEILSNIDTFVKGTNGQTEDIKLITSQLASFGSATTWPKIELALYQLAMENPNKIFMACPLYIFDYTDNYHLNNIGSKWLGAYLGLTYKRVVIDGEDWKPVHPISHVKQGRVLEVKFHVPVQPLVFDTDQVAKNTDTYGFSLVDNTGTAISIQSVVITQPDTLKFVTAAPIPTGSKLRYAWTPVTQPNRTTGPRGNLRDSQGDTIIFDQTGINKRMDNWCPILEYIL